MRERILIISCEFPPDCGGAGTVGKDNAEYLSKKGIDVTVVTSASSAAYNKNTCYNVIGARYIPKIFPVTFIKVLKSIKYENYDKIILNDVGACLIASIFFKRKSVNKCIVYLQGTEPEMILINPKLFFKILNFRKKYIELLEASYKIICVSQFMKKKLLMHDQLKNLNDKISVIYNGTDLNTFYAEKINLKAILNINKDDEIIFTASRIIKDKGYEKQYNIFKQLISMGQKYHWIIAGEGSYLRILKEKAVHDNLTDKITFVGNLDKDKLRKYYSSSDVFWLLSQLQESFGLVYLESIICGTPVIANKIGGVNEAVKDRINGILVNSEKDCLSIFINKSYKALDCSNKAYINDLKRSKSLLLKYCLD